MGSELTALEDLFGIIVPIAQRVRDSILQRLCLSCHLATASCLLDVGCASSAAFSSPVDPLYSQPDLGALTAGHEHLALLLRPS